MKKIIFGIFILMSLNSLATTKIKTFGYKYTLNSWLEKVSGKVCIIAIRPYVTSGDVSFMVEYNTLED